MVTSKYWNIYVNWCHILQSPSPRPNPCLSVPILRQVRKTFANKGFLERRDGNCQQKCQSRRGRQNNSPELA